MLESFAKSERRRFDGHVICFVHYYFGLALDVGVFDLPQSTYLHHALTSRIVVAIRQKIESSAFLHLFYLVLDSELFLGTRPEA